MTAVQPKKFVLVNDEVKKRVAEFIKRDTDEIMEVEFPVIESEYSFINQGMPVGIIPFINDSTTITGRITQINPLVDENGMVKVKAEFPKSTYSHSCLS